MAIPSLLFSCLCFVFIHSPTGAERRGREDEILSRKMEEGSESGVRVVWMTLSWAVPRKEFGLCEPQQALANKSYEMDEILPHHFLFHGPNSGVMPIETCPEILPYCTTSHS